MKKVIFSLLFIGTASIFAVNAQTTAASPLKIGIFDMDNFVQRMPEFATVIQPKLESYQRDSLGPQRDTLQMQYNHQDSIYMADSLAKKPAAVLNYDRNQLMNLAQTLYNWQQIVQQATQQKYIQVAKPYYDKVTAAYKQAVANNHITLVLNPQAVEDVPDPKSIVNLFDVVSKAMGITLTNGQQQAQQ